MGNVTLARWKAQLRFDGSTGTGAALPLDPAGEDAGAKPSDLLLLALAGCTGMDVISICRKKRQAVETYEVEARGEQRDTHPRTFEWIEVEHRFSGEALDEGALARSIYLSAARYCLVNAHLAAGDTRITHRLVIRDSGGERTAEVIVTGPLGAGIEPRRPVELKAID